MRYILLLFLSLSQIGNLSAQAKLSFKCDGFLLDSLYFEDKMTVYEAKCFNIGDKPLYLIDYESSCGCTKVEMNTNEAIFPGDSAYIKVINTFLRPGKFRYHLRIFYHGENDSQPSTGFFITGIVNGGKRKYDETECIVNENQTK